MNSPKEWVDAEQDALGWGFDGARRFHLTLGLKMTPAERLHWLETSLVEMQQLCGLAHRQDNEEDLLLREEPSGSS